MTAKLRFKRTFILAAASSFLTLGLTAPAIATSPPVQKVAKIKVRPPAPIPTVDRDAHYIQVALLLDTSNSMDGLINQAKSQLWTLVNELADGRRDGHAPHLQIALYEYGNDSLSISRGYIRQVLPLTDDLDTISEELFGLRTNGGSEYAGQVISAAVDDLEWSDSRDALKLVIIAGNEPFTQGPVSYQSACEQARRGDIIIDTIHCGDSKTGIRGKWKAGADCGGGVYMTINTDAKTVHIDSPYDDQILELNQRLNDTYYGYGQRGREAKSRQMAQDSNASSFSKKGAIERSKSKVSSAYKNESWDIVDGFEADEEQILSLADDQLPDVMKGMDADARTAFIAEKKSEREAIQVEIKALEKQRQSFIADARKAAADTQTLDNVMVKAVRKQAESKGYNF